MPITQTPGATSFSGGGMPGAMPTMGGQSQQNPWAAILGGMPQGGVQFQSPIQSPGQMAPNFENVMGLLNRPPESMANNILPGLAQILGLQTQAGMPALQNQTSELMAGAQNRAMQRGLTGSSIEAADITGAQAAGQANQNQFLGQQLGKYADSYQGLMSKDVAQQNEMIQNIAQALGQEMSNRQSAHQFELMLQSGLAQAGMNAGATTKAGMFGGAGAALGPLLGVLLKAAL